MVGGWWEALAESVITKLAGWSRAQDQAVASLAYPFCMAIDHAGDRAGEISELSSKLAGIEAVLDTEGMRKEAEDLRERAADPALWEDQENAQAVTRRLSYLDAELARLEALHRRLDDLGVMFELLEDETDEQSLQEALTELASI